MKGKRAAVRYWLMKSEPEAYSIDDLMNDREGFWDGVRNYQVRNFMRDEMQVGDLALFYHSNTKPLGVAGVMKISSGAKPDPLQFDPKNQYFDARSDPQAPRWLGVEVQFVKKFPKVVTLEQLRQEKQLQSMQILQKGNRLSVTPLTKNEFDRIIVMAARN